VARDSEPDGARGPDSVVSDCVSVLGTRLTAYVAGAAATGSPEDLARGPRQSAALARLAAVRQLIDIFAAANRLSLVRPWLQECGAAGEPAAPADLVRAATDDDDFKEIHQAATSFAAAAVRTGPLRCAR